jgi:hypothetical protein
MDRDEMSEMGGRHRETVQDRGERGHPAAGGAPSSDTGADEPGLHTVERTTKGIVLRADDKDTGVTRGKIGDSATTGHAFSDVRAGTLRQQPRLRLGCIAGTC